MPKLKLRDWQFGIIAEALKDRAQKELMFFYHILHDALGEDFDFSNASSVNCEIFKTKKNEALTKHERLRDIAKAKIDLFEAEHRGETLNDEEVREIATLQSQFNAAESMIEDITEKFDTINTIEKMIEVIERKSHETDIIKKYDDDPKPAPVETDDGGDDEPYPPTWNWGD